MTERRFSAPRVASAPRQIGASAAAAARSNGSGNAETTRESRRETHGAFTRSDIERLKQLEDDYSKLKQIVAGLDLD